NDTACRMVLDINRCLLYSGESSFPASSPKRYFAFVDGIVGGQGNGPASPDPAQSGVLVAGGNPVAVDCVCTRLMGFDPMKVRQLRGAFGLEQLPLANFGYDDVSTASNATAWH